MLQAVEVLKATKQGDEIRVVRIVFTVLHLLRKLGPAADDTFTMRASRERHV